MLVEILSSDFPSGEIPVGWCEEFRNATFEDGCLRTNNGARFFLDLPGGSGEGLRVVCEIKPLADLLLSCGDGSTSVDLNFSDGIHKVVVYARGILSKRYTEPSRAGSEWMTIELNIGSKQISGSANGSELVSFDGYSTAVSFFSLELGLWTDCLVRSIHVFRKEVEQVSLIRNRKRNAENMLLEVNVDFFDNLAQAPWTEKMLNEMFREMSSWGTRRCHWIHCGDQQEGWWQNAGARRMVAANARQTYEEIGEFFPAAVKAAHNHGMEIVGLFKPFDMGFSYSYGEAEKDAEMGKLSRLGGSVYWITDFAAQRRDLLMARKPGVCGRGPLGAITRIDLIKENADRAAFTIRDIRLYVSDDNTTYAPYRGPMDLTETIEDCPLREPSSIGGRPNGERKRSLVMRFQGLDLRSKYFALHVESRGGTFANELINLLRIYTAEGEERCITYGLGIRHTGYAIGAGAKLMATDGDFRRGGFEFDWQPGTPSAVYPGYSPIGARYVLDAGQGILAVARGKEQTALAALSPSFGETREWWLSWLRSCLDAGADGVEIRMRTHHSHLAWREFGFESPVRDAFLQEQGVDIWESDDFNLEAWRRLRGRAYTEFLSEVRRLTNGYGKTAGLHISPTLEMDPAQGGAMEIHWDWRNWLDTGLADRVTMKEVWPGTKLAEEILAHTRDRGISTIFCPYANELWSRAGGEKVCQDWINLARNNGIDGYQFYECASILRATEEGRLIMEQPALRNVFKENFVDPN